MHLAEKNTQNDILREFGTKRWLRLWRSNTGVARFGERRVVFGVPGQADLTGILMGGRRLEIEVKSPTGKQSPEQAVYGQMIEQFGGIYILARSVADVRTRLLMEGYPVE